LGNPKKSRMA